MSVSNESALERERLERERLERERAAEAERVAAARRAREEAEAKSRVEQGRFKQERLERERVAVEAERVTVARKEAEQKHERRANVSIVSTLSRNALEVGAGNASALWALIILLQRSEPARMPRREHEQNKNVSSGNIELNRNASSANGLLPRLSVSPQRNEHSRRPTRRHEQIWNKNVSVVNAVPLKLSVSPSPNTHAKRSKPMRKQSSNAENENASVSESTGHPGPLTARPPTSRERPTRECASGHSLRIPLPISIDSRVCLSEPWAVVSGHPTAGDVPKGHLPILSNALKTQLWPLNGY